MAWSKVGCTFAAPQALTREGVNILSSAWAPFPYGWGGWGNKPLLELCCCWLFPPCPLALHWEGGVTLKESGQVSGWWLAASVSTTHWGIISCNCLIGGCWWILASLLCHLCPVEGHVLLFPPWNDHFCVGGWLPQLQQPSELCCILLNS